MLAIFVASAAGDSRFREVHDLKCVGLILDAAFDPEVKPLLMSARVRVHLHEQVVRVFVQRVPLRLQQIARFKNRIEQ